MYYYGARYYDPRVSIFVSVDPLAEKFIGWMPYHYVHNNPINMVDPTGMEAEWIPGTDGQAISYSIGENGQINWSENTSDKMKELGNNMMRTSKGKSQLDTALNSKDVKVEVVINKGRKSGESGPHGGKTFGTAKPLDFQVDSNGKPTKVIDGVINLYPKAYEDIINYVNGDSSLKSFFDINYDGYNINPTNYSIMENLSTTFGHEIEHIFDETSSTTLNKYNNRTNDTEEKPNKVSREIYEQLDQNKGK